MFTRQQLKDKGLLNVFPYSIMPSAFLAMARGRSEKGLKLYHSDVYYCRAAIEKHSGFLFSLPDVEKSMKAEGWREKGKRK